MVTCDAQTEMSGTTNLRVAWQCGADPVISPCNGILGVSFSKTAFFSLPMMREYVLWSAGNIRDLLILIADHFEVHNQVVFRGLSQADAERRTRKAGSELMVAYQRAIPEHLHDRVRVALASELLECDVWKDLLADVRRIRDCLDDFNRDLTASVLSAVGGRALRVPWKSAERHAAVLQLQEYLIEELALIFYYAHCARPRYELSIFPYRPQDVVLNVYSGPYSQSFRHITGGQTFRAVQLVPEPHWNTSEIGTRRR